MKRVGYSLSDKLKRNFKIEEFKQYCRGVGIELVEVDLDRSLDEQGPFDFIFHKLVDNMCRARHGDLTDKLRMLRFESYVNQHTDMILMDPLDGLRKLMDRSDQYHGIQTNTLFKNDSQFLMPAFVKLNSMGIETNIRLMKESGVKYPAVCKPTIAHGFKICHKMSIIFDDNGLGAIEPPCVAQTFINHGAILYKLYVIGHQYCVVTRPSVKNFSSCDHETIHFNSQDVCKAQSSSYLNMMDKDDDVPTYKTQPEARKFHQIAVAVQDTMGLAFFGVDVIIEQATGRYAVIDINSVPGYHEWDFCKAMSNVIRLSIERKQLAKVGMDRMDYSWSTTWHRDCSPPASKYYFDGHGAAEHAQDDEEEDGRIQEFDSSDENIVSRVIVRHPTDTSGGGSASLWHDDLFRRRKPEEGLRQERASDVNNAGRSLRRIEVLLNEHLNSQEV